MLLIFHFLIEQLRPVSRPSLYILMGADGGQSDPVEPQTGAEGASPVQVRTGGQFCAPGAGREGRLVRTEAAEQAEPAPGRLCMAYQEFWTVFLCAQ